MSPQADFIVSNGTGAAVRSDLNVQFAAIVSNNSGATEPATMYAYQWWADTTAGLLKLRNSANSAWITMRQLDGEFSTVPVENGSAAAPSIYFKDSGTDSGFFSPGTDAVAISTAGTNRLHITSGGLVGIGTSSPAGIVDVAGASFVRFANSTAPTLSNDTHAGEALFLRSGGSAGDNNVQALLAFGKADGGSLRSGSAIGAVQTTADADQVGLAFYTSSSSSSSQTLGERVRITHAGNVGIGVTGPQSPLHVNGTGDVAIQITNGTTGTGATDGSQITVEDPSMDLVLRNRENATIRFLTNNTERGRFDASGRLLVGTSTVQQVTGGDSPFIQLQGTYASESALSVIRHSANSAGSWISLGKSRGSAAGAVTVVLSGDTLGTIAFVGADGTDLNTIGAQIRAEVDGTPGSDDLPSRLTFSTTADAASSPTERFRISSDGSFSSVIPGGSTLYPRFGCRAWVNFNGTGTVAIRASGNVSSITDNGVGDYTVNFTTAMVDANYAAVGMNSSTGSPNRAVAQALDTTPVAGSVRIKSFSTSSNTLADEVNILVAVFR